MLHTIKFVFSSDRLETINLRMDDINLRENSIRVCLQAMDCHMSKLEELALRNTNMMFELQKIVTERLVADRPPNLERYGSLAASSDPGDERPQLNVSRSPRKPTSGDERPGSLTGGPCKPSALLRGLSVGASEARESVGLMPIIAPRAGTRTRHLSLSSEQTELEFKEFPEKSRAVERLCTTNKMDLRVRFLLGGDASDGEKEDLAVKKIEAASMSNAYRGYNFAPWGYNAPLPLTADGFSAIVRPKDMPRFPKLAVSPLTPIVTPNRTEYTSITDDIDTSDMNRGSPPSTPSILARQQPLLPHEHKRLKHKKFGGKKKKSSLEVASTVAEVIGADAACGNDHLKKAEETEHQQMEMMVHKRMRHLSLTESETIADLAKHALQSIESVDEEDPATLPTHFSDDDDVASCSIEQRRRGMETACRLKTIRSAPALALKDLQVSCSGVDSLQSATASASHAKDSYLNASSSSLSSDTTELAAKNLSVC